MYDTQLLDELHFFRWTVSKNVKTVVKVGLQLVGIYLIWAYIYSINEI